MKRVLMLAAVCAAVSSAFAATTTTWTGNGADNRWGNPANWDNGVPTAAQGETALFPAGADWTVEIDEECLYWIFSLPAGSGKVTLTGTGTLTYGPAPASGGGSARYLNILTGRELVIDGPTVTPWSYRQEGKMTILSGCVEGAGKGHQLSDGAELVVAGGTFDCNTVFGMTNGSSKVTMTGGCMKLSYADKHVATVGVASSFRVLGGELMLRPNNFVVEEGADFLIRDCTVLIPSTVTVSSDDICSLLPKKGGVLSALSSSNKAMEFYTPVTNTYSFAGTLVVTNGGAIAFTLNNGSKDLYTFTLGGGGSIVADRIRHFPAKSGGTLTLDLQSLTLGAGGIESTDSNHNGHFTFVNGIEFGAYGDWAQTDKPDEPTSFTFEGPVAFNTLDAFDDETTRTMTLTNVSLASATSLKCVGGGTVNLRLRASTPTTQLHELSLVGSTALSMMKGPGALIADELTVANGSQLSIAPDRGGRLDAVDTARLAAGSVKLDFANSAFATNRCPVYFAPTGTDPDLTAFDVTDMPDGLSLAKRENTVYLTDGSADANDTSKAKEESTVAKTHYCWTGQSDDILSADNWYPTVAVTTDPTGIRHFNGWKNMVVTNTAPSARPNQIVIGEQCGPFLMQGSAIRPADQDPSIVSYSDYPAVFELKISKPNESNFSAYSHGGGYVALTGGGTLTGSNQANTNNFTFAGDVRLGGDWQFKTLASKSGQTRATRLTLLSGATLTTTQSGRSTVVETAATFAVLDGASLTIGNQTLEFRKEGVHIVDGAWTVACPLVATKRQTFRGAGTLKVSSLAAAAGGIEIAETVRLVPGDWTEAAKVFFRDTPTVKTEAGTTIGEAVSFELEPHATLTVDTADGDLVMETPILGGGDVVKTGANALVLNCAGNVVDTLTVSGGMVKPGPALVAAADAGYVPFLTVKTLVGELAIDNAKVVATVNADGTTTYSFKNKHGMMLLVR